MTRAQLFKNLATREEGLLARFDLLVLDEGQSIEFKGRVTSMPNSKTTWSLAITPSVMTRSPVSAG